MINIQPIEKRAESDGKVLDVHSLFYTIQGEGPYTGHPAVFIRLAGCNLQCPGCDTEYTQGRKALSIPEITAEVERSYANSLLYTRPIVVITGGEPFRQNIAPLVRHLKRYYQIQIETNGSFGFEDVGAFRGVDIICSPKTGKVHYSIVSHACAFKYVLHYASVDPSDGLPVLALDHSASPKVARPPLGMTVYLQPMDCKDETENFRNQKAVLESCLRHGYIVQLQLHKYLGVE